MAENKITIELTNSLAELDRLNRSLKRFGSAHGLAPKCLMEINLAIDEIFTNIVSYAFHDQQEHRIVVSLTCAEKHIVVRVEDDEVLAAALAEAGASLADTLRVVVYLARRDDLMPVCEVIGEAFRDIRPANTTVIASLALPEMLVEIEVTASQ